MATFMRPVAMRVKRAAGSSGMACALRIVSLRFASVSSAGSEKREPQVRCSWR